MEVENLKVGEPLDVRAGAREAEPGKGEPGEIGALADGVEEDGGDGSAFLSPETPAGAGGGAGEGRRRDDEAEVLDAAGGGVLDPALDVGVVSAAGGEGDEEGIDPAPAAARGEEPVDARDKVIGGGGDGVGGEVEDGGVGPAVAPEAAPPGGEDAGAYGVLEGKLGEDVEADDVRELGEAVVAVLVNDIAAAAGGGGGEGGGGRGKGEVGGPAGLLRLPHDGLAERAKLAPLFALLGFMDGRGGDGA